MKMKYLCLLVVSLFGAQNLNALIFYDEFYKNFVELFWEQQMPNPSFDNLALLQTLIKNQLEFLSDRLSQDVVRKIEELKRLMNDSAMRSVLELYRPWSLSFESITTQGIFLRLMPQEKFKKLVQKPWEGLETLVKPRDVLIREERYSAMLNADNTCFADEKECQVFLEKATEDCLIDERIKILNLLLASCEKKLQELSFSYAPKASWLNVCGII